MNDEIKTTVPLHSYRKLFYQVTCDKCHTSFNIPENECSIDYQHSLGKKMVETKCPHCSIIIKELDPPELKW